MLVTKSEIITGIALLVVLAWLALVAVGMGA